jgi:serine/threonine protein kinase
VAAVHRAGYIHRDLCPRNFVLAKDLSGLKLIDFGLTVPAKPEFMQPGNRTGTPNYMAPEIVRRRRTDHRVDIFSFGVTAFELFTFELPWPRGTDGKAALAHDTEQARDIRQLKPDIHPRLAEAIMKCIAPPPTDRPETMEQFLAAISTVKSETA